MEVKLTNNIFNQIIQLVIELAKKSKNIDELINTLEDIKNCK